MRPTVFVVLVNYNRWPDTIECIESVLRSDYPNVRVVLVDNGSQDGSVERIVAWASGKQPYAKPLAPEVVAGMSWPPVSKPIEHVVVQPEGHRAISDGLPRLTLIASANNLGFSGGNNLALRLLLDMKESGYALLLNNDMVISASSITAMVEAAERDPGVAATGGVMLEYQDPTRVQAVAGGTYTMLATSHAVGRGLRQGSIPRDLEMGYVGGGFLLIGLDTLRKVGLLDDRFFLYGEDIDWGLRMTRAGYRLAYTTDAEVWHKGSITMGPGSPFQDYHVVKAQLQFVRKHAPLLTPVALCYALARSLAPKIARRQWPRAQSVTRAMRDALTA